MSSNPEPPVPESPHQESPVAPLLRLKKRQEVLSLASVSLALSGLGATVIGIGFGLVPPQAIGAKPMTQQSECEAVPGGILTSDSQLVQPSTPQASRNDCQASIDPGEATAPGESETERAEFAAKAAGIALIGSSLLLNGVAWVDRKTARPTAIDPGLV